MDTGSTFRAGSNTLRFAKYFASGTGEDKEQIGIEQLHQDKRSKFEIMKESIVDFHQAFDYVNQEFQNYNSQKR